MSTQMTYRQFADHLKQRQRLRLRRMRDPQDDWLPEAHFVPGATTRTVAIDPRYFADRRTKRALVEDVLVPAIRVERTRMFGLQIVTYAISSDNPDPVAQAIMGRKEYDPEGIPDFDTVPGRSEMLSVVVWDAERVEMWTAEITRPKSGPPRLGNWLAANVDSIWGPMLDPITEALR